MRNKTNFIISATLFLIGAILIYYAVYKLVARLEQTDQLVKRWINQTAKVEVVYKTPVYLNGVKINGDCALVDPPCWDDFYHSKVKLSAEMIEEIKK